MWRKRNGASYEEWSARENLSPEEWKFGLELDEFVAWMDENGDAIREEIERQNPDIRIVETRRGSSYDDSEVLWHSEPR
jgi:hypothetical protein